MNNWTENKLAYLSTDTTVGLDNLYDAHFFWHSLADNFVKFVTGVGSRKKMYVRPLTSCNGKIAQNVGGGGGGNIIIRTMLRRFIKLLCLLTIFTIAFTVNLPNEPILHTLQTAPERSCQFACKCGRWEFYYSGERSSSPLWLSARHGYRQE